MARSTVYNNIVTEEKLSRVNSDNIELLEEFIEYLSSIDRAILTIINYTSDLKIVFCWNLENNKNKFFIDFTKRDIIKLQNHLLNTMNLSSGRVRRLRSSLSSLSNYIENILDDEYPNFRNIINKIQAPVNNKVRVKTILSKEQLQGLLDWCVDNKEYQKACLLALASFSGSRKSELLRFKVDSFSDDNIILDGQLYKTEKIITKGRGKAGKVIHKFCLVESFKPYLDLWLKERAELGIDNEWLFVSSNQNIYELMKISTLDSYAKTFSKVIQTDFYWHSLRHYCATYLSSEKKLPDKVIKDFFGWESLEMVNIYNDKTAEDEFGEYFK